MDFGLTIEIYNKIKKIIYKYKVCTFKVVGSRARGRLYFL